MRGTKNSEHSSSRSRAPTSSPSPDSGTVSDPASAAAPAPFAEHAPTEEPAGPSAATGPNQPLSPSTASSLFGHVAPVELPAAHSVKTQAVHNDPGKLLDAISNGTNINPQRDPQRKATVRSTSKNLLEQGGEVGLRGANQYACMLATAERESHLGNLMTELSGEPGPDRFFDSK